MENKCMNCRFWNHHDSMEYDATGFNGQCQRTEEYSDADDSCDNFESNPGNSAGITERGQP